MTVGAATTAFAKDYQGADGWNVTFDGSKMNSNFQDSDVTDEMANIQPGDSIELKVQVTNSDSGKTDWYMTNEVIQTLEDAQATAEGGGYTYRLTYVGAAIQKTYYTTVQPLVVRALPKPGKVSNRWIIPHRNTSILADLHPAKAE